MFVTAVATPVAIKVAPKIGAVDVPKDNRRMHKRPVPRFGGIAIYLGVLVGFIRLVVWNEQILGLLVGSTLILILGIVDDIMVLLVIQWKL